MGLLLAYPIAFAVSLGFLTAIAKAAIGLGFVIFVHELGHFLVAKLCGVKCEKFYVGFDVPIRIGPFQLPRTLLRKQWGETEYGIGIVPLGGYVKMLGQDDNPANSSREAERIRVAREGSGDTENVDAKLGIDPRSYPAKTVLQRLAIISAGVIMNLIFAVIFGMVAYRMGVTYTPTIVGAASPGLSAWDVGLQTGDRILQMGREGQPSEHLRFDKDMMVKVMMTGANHDLDLLVQRYTPPGESAAPPEWVTVHLTTPDASLRGRPMIGIGQCGTNVISTSPEMRRLFDHHPANQTKPALEAGDRIVAVNGTPVADYPQLTRELAQRIDEPLELRLERATNSSPSSAVQELSVTVAPDPVRSVGAILQIGAISSVQRGSPAEAAGFQVGDKILSVQGQSDFDPLELPDRLRRLAGEQVTVEVERAGARLALQVTPRPPLMLQPGAGPERSIAVESLGVAYPIQNQVVALVPGSPAETAGLVVGDLLEAAEFVPSSPEDQAIEEEIFGGPGQIERLINRLRNALAGEARYGKPAAIELGADHLNWPQVHDRIRLGRPTTKVKLSFKRGDRLESVEMAPVAVPGWYYADRGLNTTITEEVHQVDSWSTCLQLGIRETWDGMRQVYFILFRLVTGQMSPLNLGGPASIATMAGMEASQSTPRLLIFLVLLSANLAVVNFLPIPVLDGGHAMFLLYEGIFRRPVNERVAFGLTMVGFCFILGLMIFVIGLDVWRLSGLAG